LIPNRSEAARPSGSGPSRAFRKPVSARPIEYSLILLLVVLSPPTPSRAGPPSEIDPAASCVSSECHSAIIATPTVHWKDFDAVGQCQECHVPSGTKHLFSVQTDSEACLRCHEELGSLLEDASSTHEPIEEGCLDCHDPHGGQVKALLKKVVDKDLKPLCFECHEDSILKEKHKHGPADLGECNTCHASHGSEYDGLLVASDPVLCAECHEELAAEIEESDVVHDPAQDACLDCHVSHSSAIPKLLIAEKRKLCNECHDDVVELAETATVDHKPTTTKDECIQCHTPHAGEADPNLRKPQPELCLECHDEPVDSDGKKLASIGKQLAKSEAWHEPIRKKGCTACHQPHGGENFRLLEKSFPSSFYTTFSVEAYALCFSCHKENAFTKQWTRSTTRFRNGDRNLHFLHVNKEKRGRTCRACHDMHASPNPRQIRDTVPYGAWLMPLNYKQTEFGGSCRPGCHTLREYDRNAGNQPKK